MVALNTNILGMLLCLLVLAAFAGNAPVLVGARTLLDAGADSTATGIEPRTATKGSLESTRDVSVATGAAATKLKHIVAADASYGPSEAAAVSEDDRPAERILAEPVYVDDYGFPVNSTDTETAYYYTAP